VHFLICLPFGVFFSDLIPFRRYALELPLKHEGKDGELRRDLEQPRATDDLHSAYQTHSDCPPDESHLAKTLLDRTTTASAVVLSM
jgi:hypothetical protein